MAKEIQYIVNTEVPVYEGTNLIFNTDTLLKEKFTFSGVGNTSATHFTLSADGIFTSNNAGEYYEDDEYNEEGYNASMRWTPKTTLTNLSFNWKVSSEENYDILYIYHNSTLLIQASGDQSGTIGPLNLTTSDY